MEDLYRKLYSPCRLILPRIKPVGAHFNVIFGSIDLFSWACVCCRTMGKKKRKKIFFTAIFSITNVVRIYFHPEKARMALTDQKIRLSNSMAGLSLTGVSPPRKPLRSHL